MLKWFNTYGKYLMVGIMVLLMVAFVAQSGMEMLQPNPAKSTVGTFDDGTELTAGELGQANFVIKALTDRRMIPGAPTDQADLWWAMLQHDATANLGLDVSMAQVNGQLKALLGEEWSDTDPKINDQKLKERTGTGLGTWQLLVRELLIYQDYMQLVSSQPNAPETTLLMAQMLRNQQQAGQPVPNFAVDRLSNPLIKHLIVNDGTRAQGQLVTVDADRYLDQAAAPTEAQIQALFDKHKEDLADNNGRFGYRVPARVKLETLQVPLASVLDQVPAPKATEITAYYDAHKDEESFQGKTEYEARESIIGTLKQQAARELAQKAIDRARDILTRQLASQEFKTDNAGRMVIPADFAPMPLTDVASQIASEFGFEPVVNQAVAPDAWQTLNSLARDPALQFVGYQASPTAQPHPLAQYLASAKAFETTDFVHPLAQLQLQVGVPSKRLIDFLQGDAWMVRLAAAEPNHVPAKLNDEWRPQVEADARRLNAYDQLKADVATWQSQLAEGGLPAVGLAAAKDPTDFTIANTHGGSNVPGVGTSKAFGDAVFDAARSAQDALPTQGTVLLDDHQMLAAFTVNTLTNMTESRYLTQAGNPQTQLFIGGALAGPLTESPLSLDALKARTGYQSTRPEDEDAEEMEGIESDNS